MGQDWRRVAAATKGLTHGRADDSTAQAVDHTWTGIVREAERSDEGDGGFDAERPCIALNRPCQWTRSRYETTDAIAADQA